MGGYNCGDWINCYGKDSIRNMISNIIHWLAEVLGTVVIIILLYKVSIYL